MRENRQIIDTSKNLAFLQTMLAAKEKALKNYLGNKDNALRFMTAVMHSLDKTPKLLECTPQSVIGAFMECAALGLYPGSASGECYVLPYAGKAQFQLGYKGVKTLAYRSGILACGADVVYANDKFKLIRGTHPRIEHEEAVGDRGAPIGAYGWAEVTPGNVVFEFLRKDDILKIKMMSPSKNSPESPWNSTKDPMMWMWRKTAFKQAAKMMPMSTQMNQAIQLDNISERGGYFEEEGKLVEVGFDTAEVKIEAGKNKKAQLRESQKDNQSKKEFEEFEAGVVIEPKEHKEQAPDDDRQLAIEQ